MVRIYEQNISALHYDIWCKIGTFALNLLGTLLLKVIMMDSTASSSKGIIEAYFRPKKWEYIADKTIYDFMGIRLYKSIMPLSGMTEKKTYLTLADLQLYDRKTRSYELRHWLGIVGTLLIALILPHSYTVFDYCFLLFLTLVFNVYPIALQRHNRIRIYRTINMLKNRTA